MALNLDARQRAMLQEMGITVWAPAPQPERPAEPAPQTAPQAAQAAVQAAPPQPRANTAPPQAPPPAAAAARADQGVRGGYALGPARPVYPQAPAEAPGAAWLVVAECAEPDDPFAGDAGRLLDNMLRALRLHHNPRVFVAPLLRAEGGHGPAADEGLGAALAQTQAAVVLALGLPAARTVLGRGEPLGRLRASPQAVEGTPVVVTYDPAYLLRAPQAKASAWADLCRAAALVAMP